MKRTRRVAIVQPAVPQYRVPLFTRLIDAGEDAGIRIDVYAGRTPTETRARGDSSDATFVHGLRTHEVTIRGRTLFYKSTTEILRGNYDLVILELAARNIETYELLIRLKGAKHVAFWGHGRTYTKKVATKQDWFKYWIARQARWFFGYTERGVDAVVEQGFPRNRTTVLNNTIDTAALSADLSMVTAADAVEFSRHHDLRGRTALYLGGIDACKRIPFLLESASKAHELCADFRLLIAGDGAERFLVERFVVQNTWATYLGIAQGQDKARALAAAQVLCIPGRVGLVAVDSLAAGVPIVTTDFPYHAPEFDYLENGATVVVTADSIGAYALALVNLLNDQRQQKEMSDRCRTEAEKYTLERMVSNFLTGIKSAL